MEISIKEMIMHPAQLVETDVIEIKAKKMEQICSDEHMSIETKIRSNVISEKEGYSYIQVGLIPESNDFSVSVTVRGKFVRKYLWKRCFCAFSYCPGSQAALVIC